MNRSQRLPVNPRRRIPDVDDRWIDPRRPDPQRAVIWKRLAAASRTAAHPSPLRAANRALSPVITTTSPSNRRRVAATADDRNLSRSNPCVTGGSGPWRGDF